MSVRQFFRNGSSNRKNVSTKFFLVLFFSIILLCRNINLNFALIHSIRNFEQIIKIFSSLLFFIAEEAIELKSPLSIQLSSSEVPWKTKSIVEVNHHSHSARQKCSVYHTLMKSRTSPRGFAWPVENRADHWPLGTWWKASEVGEGRLLKTQHSNESSWKWTFALAACRAERERYLTWMKVNDEAVFTILWMFRRRRSRLKWQ